MLGPFVEFEIDGLDDLKTAHTSERLNQMTGVATPHVSPLVFDVGLLQAIRGLAQSVDQNEFCVLRIDGIRIVIIHEHQLNSKPQDNPFSTS